MVTGMGTGLSPVMPGTFGTIPGVLIYLLIDGFIPANLKPAALVAAILLASIASLLLTPWATCYFKSEDPKNFVLDEIAGYLLVPLLFHHAGDWQTIFLGFCLFRFYDIVKIPPARQLDRDLGGKWGILLDDLVSGIFAAVTLHFLYRIGLMPVFNA